MDVLAFLRIHGPFSRGSPFLGLRDGAVDYQAEVQASKFNLVVEIQRG